MKKKDTIYVVTTMEIPNPKSKKFFDNKSRSVGWFKKLTDAIIEVENNSCDIYEGNYNYCVIEESNPGFYNYSLIEHWFKWNKKKNKYIACKKPPCYKIICGFGIG